MSSWHRPEPVNELEIKKVCSFVLSGLEIAWNCGAQLPADHVAAYGLMVCGVPVCALSDRKHSMAVKTI